MQLILAPVFAHLLPVSFSQSHAAVRSLYCMYPRSNNVLSPCLFILSL